ncbi:DNA-3-methyladenine glycosylase family protein [Enterococcus faecalis]|uniref:DNA-3-methyladenine glycosylase family protein n=1 Tax=Enterococcus faecalis TaxID=1351 RepID=UPI0019E229D9|nr:hypothetical protein [Enterococcus faecalis]EGO8510059.1 DNA-3-methyladenine glycosylase 2 family protein [Enterococcus faecalis]EGO8996529.1 DNA-3-methyladenine glycosylase 2 family protein [Enterococcus faecalis]EGQ7428082.1 DNA-3-methyladenine glycosylase 2 family protein [Enterococcus faecalis]
MDNLIKYDLKNFKVQHIVRQDERLGRLIRFIRSSEIIIEENGFQCLVKYIIGQQISDKARETIWKRLRVCLTLVTPESVLETNDTQLRNIGLSFKKIEYIKTLAGAIINKELDFDELENLSNEEIISKLTSVRGIGVWTAEMYLIFSLGRENILPKADGTVKRVTQWVYNLESTPSIKFMVEQFSGCESYTTVICAFFWRAIELDLTKKSFDEIIPE